MSWPVCKIGIWIPINIEFRKAILKKKSSVFLLNTQIYWKLFRIKPINSNNEFLWHLWVPPICYPFAKPADKPNDPWCSFLFLQFFFSKARILCSWFIHAEFVSNIFPKIRSQQSAYRPILPEAMGGRKLNPRSGGYKKKNEKVKPLESKTPVSYQQKQLVLMMLWRNNNNMVILYAALKPLPAL